MTIKSIKNKLENDAILFSEDAIMNQPSVIGYDKQFRWSWLATQLNTFVVATNFEEQTITTDLIEKHLTDSFAYAKKHYNGWPRGLQSGIGVITIVLSTSVDEAAKQYCKELKSGKKWAGFSIPVAIDLNKKEAYYFDKNPIWGRIYYPYFKRLIKDLCQ